MFINFTQISAQNLGMFDRPEIISEQRLSNADKTIFLSDHWKMSVQDSTLFASPDYNDSHWEVYSTQLGPSDLAFVEWTGIGWFRKKIIVDSSLVNRPLALLFSQHYGASEIYIDGQKINEIGEIASSEEATRPSTTLWPQYLEFSEPGLHHIAIRYANYNGPVFNDLGFTAGFRLFIGDFAHHLLATRKQTVTLSSMKMFITGGLIAFTVIHFLFYLFYPAEKNNLYFSFFTGLLALLTFSTYQTYFATSPVVVITFYRMSLVVWLLTILSALRFTYSLFYDKTPIQFWFFLITGLLLVAFTWISHQTAGLFRELFILFTIAEMFRVLVIAFGKKKEGVWILGTGLIMFVGAILYTIGVNLQLFEGDAAKSNFTGSLSLIFAMSVYLSRNFAKINKHLQHKLTEVRQLSEQSLKQERLNKKKELERKLLEAENKRKSQELEEARTLQLSMLPKKIPATDKWDIAVYMDTAQEVGGDYYDFSMAKDGTITVAVGDATGHGMKAGIMVATAKSYFHTLADDNDIISILRRMSHGIKNMDLKTMFMALALVKCNGREIRITAAGMPPGLIYRSEEQKVERITIKGMPLGSRIDYPYEERHLLMQKGDTLLLMSDGIIELFNENREMFNLVRLEKAFRQASALPANDIIASLKKKAGEWLGNNTPKDDITMVVIKAV